MKRRKPKAPNSKAHKISKGNHLTSQAQGDIVVGIGASAGGLEAMEEFFKALPSDSGMSFVVVSHLDPGRSSLLAEILSRAAKIPVQQAEHGHKVAPNTVYVIPPNKDIALRRGQLHLSSFVDGAPRTAIDIFFQSLAEEKREHAVGIILSGNGSDGVVGLKAIKERGGLTLAQDPSTAHFQDMPNNALREAAADESLSPGKMPEFLLRYSRNRTPKQGDLLIDTLMRSTESVQKILLVLRARTGHDFSGYKKNTILRRLERRMRVNQIDAPEKYARYLQQNPREAELLFRELLIGVTTFFRDPEAFDILRDKLFPRLLSNKPRDETVRIWVPGCSTGEEVYSIAMTLRESMDKLGYSYKAQIFGTDIDKDAVKRCRIGLYPATIVKDVNPKRLGRFFNWLEKDNLYQIKKEIREMVIFAPQSVIKDPPFTKLDMVSCRNLLIYMDSDMQKKLLPLFHYTLRAGGLLFLGASESVGNYTDLFSLAEKRWKFFHRLDSSSARHFEIQFPTGLRSSQLDSKLSSQQPRATDIPDMLHKILLESYAPPCIITDEKGLILHVHGATGPYLELAAGEANLNIVEMAREGLRAEIAAALRKVHARKKSVAYTGLRVRTNEGHQFVDLHVRPVRFPHISHSPLIMFIFEQNHRAKPLKITKITERSPRQGDVRERERELEQELKKTKRNLQSIVEELETANEELKSANEELQSTNEELQSTNEELETSKEELQSLNEELVTVNAELQEKIEELSQSNDDMQNLLNNTRIPTLFLDNNLRIKRFTLEASQVIHVIQSDVGRPIGHLVSNLKYDRLVEDAQEVLKSLALREMEVQSKDNRWYLLRINPYRTAGNSIGGVVMTFTEITRSLTSKNGKRPDEMEGMSPSSRS